MALILISDALLFGRWWYGEPNAISNAKRQRDSRNAVIRVYDAPSNMIKTQEHIFSESAMNAQTTRSQPRWTSRAEAEAS